MAVVRDSVEEKGSKGLGASVVSEFALFHCFMMIRGA